MNANDALDHRVSVRVNCPKSKFKQTFHINEELIAVSQAITRELCYPADQQELRLNGQQQELLPSTVIHELHPARRLSLDLRLKNQGTGGCMMWYNRYPLDPEYDVLDVMDNGHKCVFGGATFEPPYTFCRYGYKQCLPDHSETEVVGYIPCQPDTTADGKPTFKMMEATIKNQSYVIVSNLGEQAVELCQAFPFEDGRYRMVLEVLIVSDAVNRFEKNPEWWGGLWGVTSASSLRRVGMWVKRL